MKQIKNFLIYILFRFIISPFEFLPYTWCVSLGRLLLRGIYQIDKRHRLVAAENIRHAFPEFSDEQVHDLVKRHYLYLGELLADSLFIARIDENWFKKYIVLDPDFQEIEGEMKTTKRKLVISGHLGNWEVMLAYAGKYLNAGSIYKPVKNPFVDKFLYKIRSRSGAVLVPVNDTIMAAREIKKGILMGFAADQNAGRAGIFVEFLNRPASTFAGPVIMASLTKARIFMVTTYKINGQLHLTGSDLGYIDNEKFIDKATMLKHYTGLWVKELAKHIKKHPEQYFWVHRRWRTKPGDFPGQI